MTPERFQQIEELYHAARERSADERAAQQDWRSGDPVFDDTLRQGLAVELQQSPQSYAQDVARQSPAQGSLSKKR